MTSGYVNVFYFCTFVHRYSTSFLHTEIAPLLLVVIFVFGTELIYCSLKFLNACMRYITRQREYFFFIGMLIFCFCSYLTPDVRYISRSWFTTMAAALWSDCYFCLYSTNWDHPWYGRYLIFLTTTIIITICLVLLQVYFLLLQASIHSLKSRFPNISSLRDYYVAKYEENSPNFKLAQVRCYLLG